MNPMISFFRTKPNSWQGCRSLSAAERMAQYSQRRAAEIQQRENAGAGNPRVQLRGGRLVLIALSGRMNHLAIETQTLREGDVLDWEIRDENGDPIICGLNREGAREFKRECGGIVCRVVVAH